MSVRSDTECAARYDERKCMYMRISDGYAIESCMVMDAQTQKKDEEIVILALGDPVFFGILMERYESRMLVYIKRISSVTNEEAEDILQDSFLKAYQNLHNFDDALSFSSWLYRIVHNETISHWRKDRIRPHGNSVYVDDDFLARIADVHDIVADIDRARLKDVVGAVLQNMDEKYRDVLVLKYIEDKSYEEIADILKKPAGTVATHLNRAKKQFRDISHVHLKE